MSASLIEAPHGVAPCICPCPALSKCSGEGKHLSVSLLPLLKGHSDQWSDWQDNSEKLDKYCFLAQPGLDTHSPVADFVNFHQFLGDLGLLLRSITRKHLRAPISRSDVFQPPVL